MGLAFGEAPTYFFILSRWERWHALAVERATCLRSRLRLWTWIFIVGLAASGLTAIPIQTQFDLLAQVLGSDFRDDGWMPAFAAEWLATAYSGVSKTSAQAPFVWYGTDWLAFGHLAIALAFVGALKDPVRNRWLYDFGLLACAAVIPWALVFGALRGIPFWWRCIDCSFGVFGAIPLWLCRRWALELELEFKQSQQPEN